MRQTLRSDCETSTNLFIHGYSVPSADRDARELLFDNVSKSAAVNVYSRSMSDRIAEEFRSRGFTNAKSFPTVGLEEWARPDASSA